MAVAEQNQGPLTEIATDLTRVIETLVKVGLGVTTVAGKSVSSLMGAAAEHVVETVPQDAPLVGGVLGLVERLAVAVLETGGLAGSELAAASERISDYVSKGQA